MDTTQLRTMIKKARMPLLQIILFTLIFFVIFFPTGDLGDLVSSKVSEVSQNQVFLQFNEFGFKITPPGLEFSEVFLETPLFQGIGAEQISFSPSISALLNKKPYGSVKAKGLLQGNLELTIKKGQSTEGGADRQRLILEIEEMKLSAVREFLKWSLPLEGNLSLTADGQSDLGLSEQPDVDININLNKFSLPPATVNTMMGPLTLPDMKLGQVHLKGRLSNGKFNIENGDIGKKQDDLYGKIKGFWNVSLAMISGKPSPQFGSYDFEVDLIANKIFQAKASLFLSLLDQYKSVTSEGTRYHFKVSAADLFNPPSITDAK